MLSGRGPDTRPPMSLRDRMKFFEAEAERVKPKPTVGRVSLEKTPAAGESSVNGVLAPISLPRRSRVSAGTTAVDQVTRCQFASRHSAAVTGVVARPQPLSSKGRPQPVENRSVEDGLDKDSGVSCTLSDDQNLSDTEDHGPRQLSPGSLPESGQLSALSRARRSPTQRWQGSSPEDRVNRELALINEELAKVERERRESVEQLLPRSVPSQEEGEGEGFRGVEEELRGLGAALGVEDVFVEMETEPVVQSARAASPGEHSETKDTDCPEPREAVQKPRAETVDKSKEAEDKESVLPRKSRAPRTPDRSEKRSKGATLADSGAIGATVDKGRVVGTLSVGSSKTEVHVSGKKPKDRAVFTEKPKDRVVSAEKSKPKDRAVSAEKPKDRAVSAEKPKPKDRTVSDEKPKPKDRAVTAGKPKDRAVSAEKPKDRAVSTEKSKPKDRTVSAEKPKQETVPEDGLLHVDVSAEVAEAASQEDQVPKHLEKGASEEQPPHLEKGASDEQLPQEDGASEEVGELQYLEKAVSSVVSRLQNVEDDVPSGELRYAEDSPVEWTDVTLPSIAEEEPPATQAPFHSPFEGTISLNMSAKESVNSPPPSHKGFLTIFQEESGLGAWNRRWCSVQDNKIYYWLYPEDQVNRNKAPHGEIDLRHCKTDKVAIASRLDCARPNTFVLTILKPAQPGDRCSIITESNGKTTQTKFLLSADSREERRQWMDVINRSLQCVVSWNH